MRFRYLDAKVTNWNHVFVFDWGTDDCDLREVDEVRAYKEEIRKWCVDQFGEIGGTGWNFYNGNFYMQHDHQAMAFRMRWC